MMQCLNLFERYQGPDPAYKGGGIQTLQRGGIQASEIQAESKRKFEASQQF